MNSKAKQPILLLLLLVAVGYLGWFLGKDAGQSSDDGKESGGPTKAPQASKAPYDPPNPDSKRHRTPSKRIKIDPDGIPNESLLAFASEEAYRKFLASLDGSGLRVLGRIDGLRVLRLGYDNPNDLEGLLGDDLDQYANYPVYVPEPLPDDQGFGGVGFGSRVLEWLGITGDNSEFGSGVKIALVDTGVVDHSSLTNIFQIDLISESLAIDAEFNPHGTSVASLIAGSDGSFSGIAPGAELVSVRVGDEAGASNSFLLAEGIMRAADEGAQLINISMGSANDSAIVQMAIEYATERGALLIASAGNEGSESLAYPAANEGVISVGAVDAAGLQMGFSNTGDALSALAPGLEIYAAGAEGYTLFSGTSASAPLLTGAIAATATEMNLSFADSYELITNNLNEAGAPGPDPVYGDGILNMGRVLQSNTSGIYDVALASTYYEPASQGNALDRLLFTVENRGTESVAGIELNITTSFGQIPYNVGTLAPNAIETYAMPVGSAQGTFSVDAQVSIPANLTDANLSDNRATGELSIFQEATAASEAMESDSNASATPRER